MSPRPVALSTAYVPAPPIPKIFKVPAAKSAAPLTASLSKSPVRGVLRSIFKEPPTPINNLPVMFIVPVVSESENPGEMMPVLVSVPPLLIVKVPVPAKVPLLVKALVLRVSALPITEFLIVPVLLTFVNDVMERVCPVVFESITPALSRVPFDCTLSRPP